MSTEREGKTELEFICDPLEPVAGTQDVAGMARGEPGLPREFLWRGKSIRVAAVLRAWKEAGDCSSGGGERYIRKHWYEVDSSRGTLRIYFERQARGKSAKQRWWLHSIRGALTRAAPETPAAPPPAAPAP